MANLDSTNIIGKLRVSEGIVVNGDVIADNIAMKTEGTFFVDGSASTTAGTWLGTCDRFTEYYDGLAIRYKIGIAGASTTTLNINGLGAKTVYRFSTTKLTTHFPVGSIINLVYHTDLNSGSWLCNDYDANTNTQMRVYRQTTGYNADYPLLVSRTQAADIATKDSNNSYEAIYGVMWNDTTKVPTLNPSTGELKAVKFTGALSGNASSATTLKNLTATVAELNYMDGVTSNVQTQLNGKAPAYQYSATDLTAGTSSLATGTLYFVYE